MESLRAIVAKASSIGERMSSDFVAVDDRAQDELVEARMSAWLHAAARGDRAAFALRLGWDGLDADRARRAVGPVQLRADRDLPSWACALADVLQLASASSTTPRARCLSASRPIPFEEILLPFVTWARSACERRAGPAYAGFDSAAHAALERQLLGWLSTQAAHALLLELTLSLAAHETPLDRLAERAPSRAGYLAFASSLLASGLPGLFEEYAVLARMLATTAELWVEATAELLERVHADADALRELLGERGELRVASVEPALSDPHRGQRAVALLTFGSGARAVYKPRGLGIEAGWNALLAWLGELGAPVAFRTFRVLDRGTYGWAECVPHAPCEDQAQAREYFEQAGALLSVVHLLCGTDCHADNLIFAGPQPVIIDLETLLTPATPESSVGAEATRIARRRLTTSVLRTYLLPFWAVSPDRDEVYDGSGFGADHEQERALMRLRWELVNTDAMRLARGVLEGNPPARATTADGVALRVHEHEQQLVAGFERMYRFLSGARSALLQQGSPFQRLARVDVRFVLRNTAIYTTVLEGLRQPERLRDGADRSLHIEQLAVAAVVGALFDVRAGWPEIWNAERDALERGDVPHFGVVADQRDLRVAPGSTVPGWFERSGHAEAIERLTRLDAADLEFQLELICSSLRSRAAAEDEAPSSAAPPRAVVLSSHGAPAAPAERWLDAAMAIGESLSRAAIRGGDGSAAWLQPAWSRAQVLAEPQREWMVAGANLYDGAPGIALFLAALARVAPSARLRDLALGALRPLQIELEQRPSLMARELGIGGLSGLGSLVYGLVQVHRLLGEPELLRAAEQAASLITTERIAADEALDVTLGAAGALLGLLALYETNAGSATLAQAVCCGQRLLERVEPTPGGARALRTLGGRFLTGFSHGAAGIAYALDRLHAVTGAPELRAAARALCEFERGAFSAQHGGWPDLRRDGPPRPMAAWCHGAPGIALGRLALAQRSPPDAEAQRELDQALAITLQLEPGSADHVCCGTFGVVDILGTAGRQLGRPDLLARAEQLAAHTISQAELRGGYALGLPSAGQLECRGLFQGIAGVGYTLLRLGYPDDLPEPLLLR